MDELSLLKNLCIKNTLIEKEEFFLIIELLFQKYKVRIIKSTDSDIVARFYYNTNTLLINYDNIIYCAILKIRNNKIKNVEINYVNLKIVQILMHELEHVKQHINEDILISKCNIQENYLKSKGLYSEHLYKCNPIERLAEINSISDISKKLIKINQYNNANIFEHEKRNDMIYGYFKNEYLYPINDFFQCKENFIFSDYDASIIGNKISKEKYLSLKKYI